MVSIGRIELLGLPVAEPRNGSVDTSPTVLHGAGAPGCGSLVGLCFDGRAVCFSMKLLGLLCCQTKKHNFHSRSKGGLIGLHSHNPLIVFRLLVVG